jgi:general secretion pathway protein E
MSEFIDPESADAENIFAEFQKALAGPGRSVDVSKKFQSYRELQLHCGLSADEFADAVARFIGAERIDYAELASSTVEAAKFSPRFLRDAHIVPFRDAGGSLSIAVSEPPTRALLKAIALVLQAPPVLRVAHAADIDFVLSDHTFEEASIAVDEAGQSPGIGLSDLDSLRDLASGAPVVRAVSELFERAIEGNATDLHIEPMRDSLTVRLRVDGILRVIQSPPLHMARAIISRIKILAGLNIAERRLPQDGSARLSLSGGPIDVRVAIMPSSHGETAVIRFLPRERGLLDLSTLGLSDSNRLIFQRILDLPHGLVIITGPTGSGKTTTLAAALSALNKPQRKILTIEDPIEYEIAGICQSQVKPEIGLTFATALRSFVRQDPDVIMVGEIRDGETAGIAVNAALTGHLVLTTLHTETAAAAVPRLIDLGVDDFLLQSTVRAVVAQRLVRLLCPYCKSKVTLDRFTCEADPRHGLIGLQAGDVIYQPVGCDRCSQSGFRGRAGIFEVFEPDSAVRTTIRHGVDAATIEAAARRAGFRPMALDALDKCRSGVTSPTEIFRVASLQGVV